MSFCTNCGIAVARRRGLLQQLRWPAHCSAGVAFCSVCQAPVAAPVQGPPTPWGKILVIVLVVVLLLEPR